MTVIAMSHEIGTYGRHIASRIAATLGVKLIDDNLMEQQIADRTARAMPPARHGYDRCSRFRRALEVEPRMLARFAAEEIHELAAYGNVLIRGWGAPSVLRDNRHVVRIRVHASPQFRLQVLAARHPATPKPALAALIERSDTCLASNLEPVLGQGWRSDDIYHLSIATETTSVADAVDRIERFVAARLKPNDRASCRLPARSMPVPVAAIRCNRTARSGVGAVDHFSIAKAEHLLFGRH